MSTKSIIEKEIEKCDKDILKQVSESLSQKLSIPDICKKISITEFDIGTYIEVCFYNDNIDPIDYLEEQKIDNIYSVLEKIQYPISLKVIKEQLPSETSYTDIRIVRGVFLRKDRYYKKKKKNINEEKIETNNNSSQISFFDMGIKESTEKNKKVEIESISSFISILENFNSEKWKNLAIQLYSYYAPKAFFIIPAVNMKDAHNEDERGWGEWDINEPKKLKKVGGKYIHTIRLFKLLNKLLEYKNPEVKDRENKVIRYSRGSEFEKEEEDILRFCALAHDMYAVGTVDEFKGKYFDRNHPHYHEKELISLKDNMGEKQWNLFIEIVGNHMGKYDTNNNSEYSKFINLKNCSTVEEAYEKAKLYRMIELLQYCDYIVSQKDSIRLVVDI